MEREREMKRLRDAYGTLSTLTKNKKGFKIKFFVIQNESLLHLLSLS